MMVGGDVGEAVRAGNTKATDFLSLSKLEFSTPTTSISVLIALLYGHLQTSIAVAFTRFESVCGVSKAITTCSLCTPA
jgi:hypothetical protein